MGLIRIGHGAEESLEDFYSNLEDDQFMVKVVQLLKKKLGDRVIYCLTSHRTLALLSQADHRAVWWVKISPMTPVPAVLLKCIAPDRFMPWPSAQVCDEVETIHGAVDKILQMIEYSEGWSDEERAGMSRVDL